MSGRREFSVSLQIASYLQMPKLMSDITSRVLDKLSVENCIQNRELGRQFHNDTLRCSSDSFLARHAADYFQTEDFTKMTCSEVDKNFGQSWRKCCKQNPPM